MEMELSSKLVLYSLIFTVKVHLSVYNRHSKAMECLLMGSGLENLNKIKFMIGCFLHIEICASVSL